ncbi:NAC domain-containing protein 78-like [Lycium ferocissimum]|uniref:NAC domain-containing protein 78-like n=1 Tax=Lycium ferocissimum TaxID=112874 RepID=UPI0028159ADD|nr:NAC domain-containing protein 78-like [Lycium ferocissimum]
MENLKDGFRFRPTDAQALIFLLRFIAGEVMNDSGFVTTNVDVYGKQEPWDIYSHGVPCDNDEGDNNDCTHNRFFITKLKKKNKSKYNRNVGNKGSWKQQDKGKPVKYSSVTIGCKKSMSYVNKNYNRKNGHWLMNEYELSSAILEKFNEDCRDYVLCAIKKRPVTTSSPSETTSTVTFLNNLPAEIHQVISNSSRNLQHSTMAFLNFQESAESNSTDKPLQVYDAGDYSLGVVESHEWGNNDLEELHGMMLHQDDMNMVDPLLAAEASYTAMLNFVTDILLDSDDIEQILQTTFY